MRSPRFRRLPFVRDGVFDHGRASAPRKTAPHMSPSALSTASASARLCLSRLNSPPRTIAVYASRRSSPSAPQHSLPSARYGLLGPDLHRLDTASFAWRTDSACNSRCETVAARRMAIRASGPSFGKNASVTRLPARGRLTGLALCHVSCRAEALATARPRVVMAGLVPAIHAAVRLQGWEARSAGKNLVPSIVSGTGKSVGLDLSTEPRRWPGQARP